MRADVGHVIQMSLKSGIKRIVDFLMIKENLISWSSISDKSKIIEILNLSHEGRSCTVEIVISE